MTLKRGVLRCQGHVTHFKFWGPELYLWNGLSYNRQILHTGRMYQILAYG